MISFALDEDQELVRETVRKFAQGAIRPHMRAWEKAREVPASTRRAFHELSLGLLDVPEAAGGTGAGQVTAALVHEELAFGDPGAAVALWAPHLAAAAVVELGDEEQARRLLARFQADDKDDREVASRVGCTREMVSRIFKDLVQRRHITLEDDRIVIHRVMNNKESK